MLVTTRMQLWEVTLDIAYRRWPTPPHEHQLISIIAPPSHALDTNGDYWLSTFDGLR